MKDDTISRQTAIDAVRKAKDKSEAHRMLIQLPSAQTDLITKILNGIKATDADDVYSCGMRNGMRWCISLIDDKEPLYENCPSAQPVNIAKLQPNCNQIASDCISRAAALDALADYIHNVDRVYSTGKLTHEDFMDAAHSVLDELPSAQPGKGDRMAEFQNVVRELQRMCKNGCADCPIRSAKEGNEPFCSKWMKKYSAEAERIIMQWAAEHQIKTNGIKFREVFGQPYEYLFETNGFIKQWLSQEYQGGQDEQN